MTNSLLSLIVISLRLHLKKVVLSEDGMAIKAAWFHCHGSTYHPLREAII